MHDCVHRAGACVLVSAASYRCLRLYQLCSLTLLTTRAQIMHNACISSVSQSTQICCHLQAAKVTVKLESEDRNTVYASAAIDDISAAWKHPKVMLKSNGTSSTAQLTLYINGAAEVSVKMLSLFPAENVKGNVLQPFRPDLLQYLKDLKPR